MTGKGLPGPTGRQVVGAGGGASGPNSRDHRWWERGGLWQTEADLRVSAHPWAPLRALNLLEAPLHGTWASQASTGGWGMAPGPEGHLECFTDKETRHRGQLSGPRPHSHRGSTGQEAGWRGPSSAQVESIRKNYANSTIFKEGPALSLEDQSTSPTSARAWAGLGPAQPSPLGPLGGCTPPQHTHTYPHYSNTHAQTPHIPPARHTHTHPRHLHRHPESQAMGPVAPDPSGYYHSAPASFLSSLSSSPSPFP